MRSTRRPSPRWTILLVTMFASVALAATGCDKSSSNDESGPSAVDNTAGNEAPTQQPDQPEPGQQPSPTGVDEQEPNSPSGGPTEAADRNQRGGPPTGAQDGPAPNQPGESAEEFTDAQLKKFVEANQTLKSQKQKLQGKLEEAESAQEAKKAQQEVMQQTRSAVEEAGLEFEKFRSIARQAQQDRDLQQRIAKLSAQQQNR